MKVGVFSTHALWPTHFETELEIMQKLLDEGDLVYQFFCNKDFRQCDIVYEISQCNLERYVEIKQSSCDTCLKRQFYGTNLLRGKINRVPLFQKKYLTNYPDESYFQSIESIKKLYIDNYDIGWSILSSLISNTIDPFVDLNLYKEELYASYEDCSNAYFNTIEIIKNYNLDKIYVFNGRFSYTKAIFRAAQKLGITCFIHERGSSINKYALFKNHLPHDYLEYYKNVNRHWLNEINDLQKNKIAFDFYSGRREGKMGIWVSFIENQKKDKIPDYFNFNKTNICLFTSSEDEFVSIDDTWDNPYFKNQLEGILYICGLMKYAELKEYKLFIRMHPNSGRLGYDYLNKLFVLHNNENIFVIKPDDPADSYSLLDKSDVIITFGSTIGYEGIFWGRYVIELGKSLNYLFKGPIRPKSKEEILSLIISRNTLIDKSDTVKIGYYMQTFGIEYKYYSPIDHMFGLFKGFDLNHFNKSPKLLSKYIFYFKRKLSKYFNRC